jgi:hypothetical protein
MRVARGVDERQFAIGDEALQKACEQHAEFPNAMAPYSIGEKATQRSAFVAAVVDRWEAFLRIPALAHR